ncbi:ATP-binding cassette domain-containing protein [Streptosporangium subroseum]|uniref:ATP-binding cassette domain-containing protein n=1 Tax=Streptosporangium subroseum TaxID=106412 RepID=UPI001C528AE1
MAALLGVNGAGRTTLLRTLSGLPDVHDGEITRGSVRCSGSGPCKARGRMLGGSRSTKRRADNDRRVRRLSRRPVG